MEALKIVYVCYDCRGYNKHQRGNEGFEEKEDRFTYFHEAVKHVYFTAHWVDSIIEKVSDE